MFVYKVAVVGPTGAGADLAAAIAAAGVPVVTDIADAGDADLVIEAAPDALEEKQALLSEVDAVAPGHAIIATITETLSVTELADATGRPNQVVGLHPVGERLVELVEGLDTAPDILQAVAGFLQSIRRTPVRSADAPGFIVARIAGAEDPFDEACAVLEENIAGVRDIDTAMAAGAGMQPGPFAAADQRGLDRLLAESEDPPPVLRRLVGQGRTGPAAGQGFYAYPRPDPGFEDAPVKLETRDDGIAIAWLDAPPANSLSPTVIDAFGVAWQSAHASARALIVASANPALFCAGADIKALAAMDAAAGKALLDKTHALMRAMGESRVPTIAAVNGLALGGGCELAMACDVRLAAFSATFGQPEINLGIIPGFGGTQRLPRLVGEAKALEMNLTGDSISAEDAFQHGLANRVVPDHELFDTALAWARKLAGKSPVAIQTIKQVSIHGTLEEGLAAEKQGFAAAFGSDDGKEGIAAFLEERKPEWQGR